MRGQQANDVSVLEHVDRRSGSHVPAHHMLELLAPRRDERLTPGPSGRPSGGTQQAHIPRPPNGYGALSGEVCSKARQQFLEDLCAASEEDMQVARLRHALSECRIGGEPVAVDDDDVGEAIRQNARGQEAGHAAADHDGPIRCRDRGGSHDRPIIHPRRLARFLPRSARRRRLQPGSFAASTSIG